MPYVRKRKDAKKAICFSLFLLLKKKPYEEISVKEISDRAGVTRMSFYRHFKNKEDVFIYFADECFNEVVELLQTMDNATLYDFILTFTNYIYSNKESVKALISINKYSILLNQYDKYMSYIWRKFVIKNKPKTLQDKYLISFLSGGAYNITLLWFRENESDTPEAIAKSLFDIFDNAIKARLN